MGLTGSVGVASRHNCPPADWFNKTWTLGKDFKSNSINIYENIDDSDLGWCTYSAAVVELFIAGAVGDSYK